jgi:hypothetical protein
MSLAQKVIQKVKGGFDNSLKKKVAKVTEDTEQGEYNSLIFMLALPLALMADGCDMLPIPVVDIILSFVPKTIVAFLIITQLGWKRHLIKIVLQVSAVLILDSLFASIPLLEMVTPITTLMVLLAWHSAKKKAERREAETEA